MKRIYVFKNMGRVCLAIGLLAATVLTSCKDNSPGSVDFSKSPALIGWQYAGSTPTPYNAIMLPKGTFTEDLEVTLSVASLTLKSNVTATIVDISSSLPAYDVANGLTAAAGDSLVALPTSQYSVPTSVTIPAGTQIVKIPVVFQAGTINFTSNPNPWAIQLKLTNANGAIIASNLNEAVVEAKVKAAVQGTYTVTGSFTDNTSASTSITDAGIYPITGAQLQTASAYTVNYYDPNVYGGNSGFDQGINSAGSESIYGSFAPVFTFSPTTNAVVGVTNYYGQNSGAHARSAILDPAVTPTASGTPGTVGYTFTVGFIMTQSGAPRTYFKETFTETGTF
jgi:hypothetical protein